MMVQEILRSVESNLERVEGLQAQKVLDPHERDVLIALEKEVEERIRQTGVVKVVNEGFWQTFGREYQAALVFRSGEATMPSTNKLLELRDGSGRIGEWGDDRTTIGPGGERLVKQGELVLYEGAKPKGEPFINLLEIEVPWLKEVTGIQNITSCSPSAAVDVTLREWMGTPGGGYFTRIVGFDIDHDGIK